MDTYNNNITLIMKINEFYEHEYFITGVVQR